jgi:MFS family permease
MATRAETNVVYGAALVQGIVLVTFPAASTIFTDPDEYDLSSSQYGAMFLPQVITAITASVLGARLARRHGSKRVYLAGLAASLVSMAILVTSTLVVDDHAVAYGLLLVATAFLGVGFGLTVPTLNTFTAAFNPDAVDRSVLVLNALLGLGTVLAPVFVAIFVGLGFWWGLPILSLILLVGLLVVSDRLPLQTHLDNGAAAATEQGRATAIPARFWLYAGFAVLYGICETMNGNWSQLEMTTELGASNTTASLTLTTFWAAVTLGRVLFATIQRRFPATRAYRLLPFVLAAAFLFTASLSEGDTAAGVLAFGLAGLGCSALLPLTISFAEAKLVAIAAAAAGWVIAAYQLGYGIAAFGAGPLQDAGISLSTIFAMSAAAAAVMGVLSVVITRPAAQQASIENAP